MYAVGIDSLNFIWDRFPMDDKKIKSNNLNNFITKLGGFWSSISGIGFLFLNMFLYHIFYKRQVQHIYDEKMLHESDIHQEEDKEIMLERIQSEFKHRLSFHGLYNLYD